MPPAVAQYTRTMGFCLKGLVTPKVWGYALLCSIVGMAPTWLAIIAKTHDVPLILPVYLIGVKEFVTAALMIIAAKKVTSVNRKWIWPVLLFITTVALLCLAKEPFYTGSWIIAALVAMSGLKTATSFSGCTAISNTQKGEYGTLRLGLLMLLIPIACVVASTLFGYLAEIKETYVFIGCAAVVLLTLFVTRNDPPEVVSKENCETEKPEQSLLPRTKLMIALSSMANGLNVVIFYTILPLFLFKYVEGDYSKFGLGLGLLGLAVFIGDQVHKILKKKESNPYNLLVISVMGIALCNILWGISYNWGSLAIVFILVQRLLSPLWNTSYYATLKKCTSEEMYPYAMQNHILFTRFSMGAGYVIASVLFISNEALYPPALIMLGALNIIFCGSILYLIGKKA